jgi:hypothetical protein
MTIHVPEHTTESMTFQLRAAGAAIDLTELTVGLVLRRLDGTLVDTAGKVEVFDPDLGTVQFTPADGDFEPEGMPYESRWSLTDADGRVGFCPNGDTPDYWLVNE